MVSCLCLLTGIYIYGVCMALHKGYYCRYERKKNVGLAIEALGVVQDKLKKSCLHEVRVVREESVNDVTPAIELGYEMLDKQVILDEGEEVFQQSEQAGAADENTTGAGLKTRVIPIILVIAGGYDLRVDENVEYLKELQQQARLAGFTIDGSDDNDSSSGAASGDAVTYSFHVYFRMSISSIERRALLAVATALLYTPDNEHFGIVPIEVKNIDCVCIVMYLALSVVQCY